VNRGIKPNGAGLQTQLSGQKGQSHEGLVKKASAKKNGCGGGQDKSVAQKGILTTWQNREDRISPGQRSF